MASERQLRALPFVSRHVHRGADARASRGPPVRAFRSAPSAGRRLRHAARRSWRAARTRRSGLTTRLARRAWRRATRCTGRGRRTARRVLVTKCGWLAGAARSESGSCPTSGRRSDGPCVGDRDRGFLSLLVAGLDASSASGEVVAGEVGDAFGERAGGEEICERVGAGVIEPAVREPDLDGVVFEGEEA